MVSTPCFDGGTQHCPCILADLGQCVACSILRGEKVCDCGWTGTCIYEEYLRHGKKSKEAVNTHVASVIEKTCISEGSFILRLQIPRKVAALCIFPGSFLLLRPLDTSEMYNVPITVMEVEDSIVMLAIEEKGPKTKVLNKLKAGQSLLATGPFGSGIQGVEKFKAQSVRKVLAVAKGMGQPALVAAARQVLSKGNRFDALIGPGNIGRVFIEKMLLKMGAEVTLLERKKDHNLPEIAERIQSGEYDLILSGGSDKQHSALTDIISKMPSPPYFAYTSNFSMTCAQGICGSCLRNGFRTCKSNHRGLLPKGDSA